MSRIRADIVVNKNADGPFLAGYGIDVEEGKQISFNNSTASIEEDTNNIKITGGVSSTGGWKGTTSSAGILGGVPIAYTGGKSDRVYGVNFQDTLNFGGSDSNSDTSEGVLMPFNGKFLYATFCVWGWSYNGYNIQLDLVRNLNTEQSNVFNISYTGSNRATAVYDRRSNPITFSADDRINFRFGSNSSLLTFGNVSVTFYAMFD